MIKIANTLPVAGSRPGMGLALANVRERLALLHDLQASFRAARVKDQFIVRLEVPA